MQPINARSVSQRLRAKGIPTGYQYRQYGYVDHAGRIISQPGVEITRKQRTRYDGEQDAGGVFIFPIGDQDGREAPEEFIDSLVQTLNDLGYGAYQTNKSRSHFFIPDPEEPKETPVSSTQRIVQIPLVVQAEIPVGMSDAEVLERIRFHLSAPQDGHGLGPHEVLNVRFTNVKEAPIQPGDLVAHRTRDLDPREVLAVGRDWIALDFGREDDVYTRVPRDNYVVDVRAEGVL